ncbi:MAG TPA: hypothetical protein ENI42_04870, partial [Thermoplasmatales archaeon]|nr:hypothetical protein [Thermoplasmatales archaeon]
MKKKKILGVGLTHKALAVAFLLVVSISTISVVTSGDGSSTVNVYLSPSTVVVGVGETFTLDLYVEPTAEINTVNLGLLTFNGSLLNVTVSKGNLFSSTVFWPSPSFSIDNNSGKVEELLWTTN